MLSPKKTSTRVTTVISALLLVGCATPRASTPVYDIVIRDGLIYDGSGGAPVAGNVAIKDDRIVAIGKVDGTARTEISARGMAVAPGFINMLSWANESLIVDSRSLSDIRQGVTLEVMGEGWSMGPLNPIMKVQAVERQGDLKFPIAWTTLGEYLTFLEDRGTATNIASFVGAGTVRIHELGEDNVDPTPAQLERMQGLVRQAMDEGAMGVASSLIYAPDSYAETDELVALTSVAAKCGGTYISHMRSEGDRLEEAIDELIEISRRSGAPAEIYHLKMAGRSNWSKREPVVRKIEAARAEGLRITADMYTYTAGSTGLDAAMPTWVQAGGLESWIERLKDPAIRARIAAEMASPGGDWENLYFGAGPNKMILINFKSEGLKPLTGKTLAEVATMRGTTPEETAMDLVVEDGSRVGTVYFLMSEDNIREQIKLPWMSFGSDGPSQSAEGVFLQSAVHPRAYGNFARLLGRYVRDEKLITLQEAVRRLTSLPASNLGIPERGGLKPGYFADIVVFDPATIMDNATFDQPHQYATAVRDVFVNGVAVLRTGEPTGATPGRAVRGPGWNRCPQ